jgi:cytochrome c oxidase subunit 2
VLDYCARADLESHRLCRRHAEVGKLLCIDYTRLGLASGLEFKPSIIFGRSHEMKSVKRSCVGIITSMLVIFYAGICSADTLEEPQQPREIKVKARKFSFEPKVITVRKGERVKLIVTSEDVDHGIAISDLGIEEEIKAKETKVIEITPEREGRFQFTCSVFCGDGHPNMAGVLVVTGGQAPMASNMKVSFDENAPGVVIVESNGERVRIDTNAKTFARVDEPAPITSPGKDKDQQPVVATKERESSKAYEPYDYYVVNIPTPKRVRRHSLNMHFTHRFQQPVRPLTDSSSSPRDGSLDDLLGLDSFSVSSFGVTFGITDSLYAKVYRSPLCQPGLCKTIEIGLGYHFLDEAGRSPVALSAYASIEGDDNFQRRFTYNMQAMIGRSVTKYVNLFFSPAVHINSNGNGRFNPRPDRFFPPVPEANDVRLGQHTGSFGFGVNGRIRPTTSLLFEYTPRVGFKLGRVVPIFDATQGRITSFDNESEAALGFGIEKRIGRHAFSLTFSNTQTTTTSRYNSSNLVLPPSRFTIGFNLFRRLL